MRQILPCIKLYLPSADPGSERSVTASGEQCQRCGRKGGQKSTLQGAWAAPLPSHRALSPAQRCSVGCGSIGSRWASRAKPPVL